MWVAGTPNLCSASNEVEGPWQCANGLQCSKCDNLVLKTQQRFWKKVNIEVCGIRTFSQRP